MTAVIITGGIDLSVGSIMGIVRHRRRPGAPRRLFAVWLGVVAGLLDGAGRAALVNGYLIAYVRLSSFVVTLGMLASRAASPLVMSDNQMIYEFGPDEKLLLRIGGGTIFGIANPFIVLVVLTLIFGFVFRYTPGAARSIAIGGNEQRRA